MPQPFTVLAVNMETEEVHLLHVMADDEAEALDKVEPIIWPKKDPDAAETYPPWLDIAVFPGHLDSVGGRAEKTVEPGIQTMRDPVVEAFTDVLDGNSAWHEIRAQTGLPEERCKEISALFAELMAKKTGQTGTVPADIGVTIRDTKTPGGFASVEMVYAKGTPAAILRMDEEDLSREAMVAKYTPAQIVLLAMAERGREVCDEMKLHYEEFLRKA